MKLLRYRVTNFRSVEDSGWIHTDDVTALIGTNESGKTNVLLPLWKLNPAKDGEIDVLSDYPRKRYNQFRTLNPQPVFIEAVFDIGNEIAQDIAKITGSPIDQVRESSVSRRYDGKFLITFPKAVPVRKLNRQRVDSLLDQATQEISTMTPLKSEEALAAAILAIINSAKPAAAQVDLDTTHLKTTSEALTSVSLEGAPKTSTIVPRFQRLIDEVSALREEISRKHPHDFEEARKLVLSKIPKFVYYSNYGNLDSEIYLPYVIRNIKRDDLGAKEKAKARTLKVLFEFVKLSPEEILELGQEQRLSQPNQELTPQQLEEMSEKKKQRSVLLQSASSDLTTIFELGGGAAIIALDLKRTVTTFESG